MKTHLRQILWSSIILPCICACNSTYTPPDAPISEVPFTQVHLEDSFWTPRIETNREVSIPSAFKECEKNGRFDNFAIAGGLKKGEHRGDFSFDDTDPYKIIEGASYSLAVKYDKELDCYLDSVITLIAAAQEPDGYLTTCVTNKCTRLSGWWGTHRWEKINSHELYNSGHLYEAAVAHYRATGKRSLLDVSIRNADLVCKVFGPDEGQIHRPSGHPIIEMALVKLYGVTGNENYLRTARYFVEETGRGTDGHTLSEYSQDHKPILQQDEIVGHAVRAGYLYSGVADVARQTGDTAYLHALTRLWDNMAGRKLYITGGLGSRAQGEGFGPDYELNNHTAYCETCAAIANVYWNHRMFLATGEAKYIDVLERALYNGVISGVSLSGDRFFYDNPLESMGQHERQRWFGCACCPGNITRFMASVPNYVYATQANDIYINLYAESKAMLTTAENRVQLAQSTGYPWTGDITVTVTPEKEQKFALRFLFTTSEKWCLSFACRPNNRGKAEGFCWGVCLTNGGFFADEPELAESLSDMMKTLFGYGDHRCSGHWAWMREGKNGDTIDCKADVPYSLEDPYWFSLLNRGDFEPLTRCLFSKLDAILKYCEIKD